MLFHPTPVSSNKFVFSKGTFIGELSELPGFTLHRVYDDACDVGFSVVSEKTGKSAVFALTNQDTDGDGDLTALHFKCVTPGLQNLKAVIFND